MNSSNFESLFTHCTSLFLKNYQCLEVSCVFLCILTHTVVNEYAVILCPFV